MADIETEKQSVVLLQDPEPKALQWCVHGDRVLERVKNDGTTHVVSLSGQEAIETGVLLIRLGHEAQRTEARAQVKQVNGVVGLSGGAGPSSPRRG